MEKITLTYRDTDQQKMEDQDACDLRRDIADLLDQELQQENAGKWIGGIHKWDTIEVYFGVTDYQKALLIIKSALKDHPLFNQIKITRESKN